MRCQEFSPRAQKPARNSPVIPSCDCLLRLRHFSNAGSTNIFLNGRRKCSRVFAQFVAGRGGVSHDLGRGFSGGGFSFGEKTTYFADIGRGLVMGSNLWA